MAQAIMTMFVKICGITRLEDALAAQEAGADCFGMIYNFSKSPRSVSHAQAEAMWTKVSLPFVLVAVNADPDLLEAAHDLIFPFALQLHGNEPPSYVQEIKLSVNCEVWKVIHLPPGTAEQVAIDHLRSQLGEYAEAGCDRIMIDTHIPDAIDEKRYGGTGLASDWHALREVVASVSVPVILMGGLNPDNVAEAIAIVRPWGVDCSSGVESSPGVKDREKIRAFVSAARRADISRKSH